MWGYVVSIFNSYSATVLLTCLYIIIYPNTAKLQSNHRTYVSDIKPDIDHSDVIGDYKSDVALVGVL